jgi:hypothetical protein
LSIKILSRKTIAEKGEWYKAPVQEITYDFPILDISNRSLLEIKAYTTSGTGSPNGTIVRILSSDNTVLVSTTLQKFDTGSSNSEARIMLEMPANAAKLRVEPTVPCYLFVQAFDFVTV